MAHRNPPRRGGGIPTGTPGQPHRTWLGSGSRRRVRLRSMTTWIWLCSNSFAADPPPDPVPLVVDAKVPVEILLEGVKLGQLYFPAEVTWLVTPGPHVVRIYTNGNPTDVPIDLSGGEGTRIVVGRTGISIASPEAPPAGEGPV